MVQQLEEAPVQEAHEGSVVCRHHWLIQAADGPTSEGVCRICGETRAFKNYVETASWGDTRLVNRPEPVAAAAKAARDQDSWEDE